MGDVSNCNDKFTSLVEGMDSGSSSRDITDKQYVKGINVVCRNAVIKTRPGFKARNLVFDNLFTYNLFTYGRFQGAKEYNTAETCYIACAVNGHVFVIDGETGRVGHVSDKIGRMSQWIDRIFFCQAEQFMIVQDGINTPMIINGLNARRADPSKSELPIGTVMAYGHGRLFIKNGRNQFLAGDIYQATSPTTVLQFTETAYLNGGGAFALPTDMGNITGMAFIADFETGTGQGPLVVFGENGIANYDVFVDRLLWQEQNIGHISIKGYGSASPYFNLTVLEDMFYMSWQGLASYRLMKSEVKARRRFARLWQEMKDVNDNDTQWLLPYASAVLFNDRILMTVNGEICSAKAIDNSDTRDYRFKGIASLDLAPKSGMSDLKNELGPAWDGIWTGIKPTHLVVGLFHDKQRCFAFTKDENNRNLLYEIDETRKYDCEDKPINCRLYTKSYPFQSFSTSGSLMDVPHVFKRVRECKIWIDKFINDVAFTLYVKPDNRADYGKVSSMEVLAQQIYSPAPNLNIIVGQPQSRSMLSFPSLDESISDNSAHLAYLSGFEFQFCLEWDGYAEIKRVDFLGKTIAQPVNDSFVPVNMRIDNPRDDFDYTSTCNFKNWFESANENALIIGLDVGNWLVITEGTFDPGVAYIIDAGIPDAGFPTDWWLTDPITGGIIPVCTNGGGCTPTVPIVPAGPMYPGTSTPPWPPFPVDPGMPNPERQPPPPVPLDPKPLTPVNPLKPTPQTPIEPKDPDKPLMVYPWWPEYVSGGLNGYNWFVEPDTTSTKSLTVHKLQGGPLAALADMNYIVTCEKYGDWPAGATILMDKADGATHGPVSMQKADGATMTLTSTNMLSGYSGPQYVALCTIKGIVNGREITGDTISINIYVKPSIGLEVTVKKQVYRTKTFDISVRAFDNKTKQTLKEFKNDLILTGVCSDKADSFTAAHTSFHNGIANTTGVVTGGKLNATLTINATTPDPKINGNATTEVIRGTPVLQVTPLTAQVSFIEGNTNTEALTFTVKNISTEPSTLNYSLVPSSQVSITNVPTNDLEMQQQADVVTSVSAVGLTHGTYLATIEVDPGLKASDKQLITITIKVLPVYWPGPMVANGVLWVNYGGGWQVWRNIVGEYFTQMLDTPTAKWGWSYYDPTSTLITYVITYKVDTAPYKAGDTVMIVGAGGLTWFIGKMNYEDNGAPSLTVGMILQPGAPYNVKYEPWAVGPQ